MNREIVILTRSLPIHGLGGMEIVAWDLAKALASLGKRVRIITTSLPKNSGEVIHDNVTVVPLENTAPGRYSSAWWRTSRQYFERNCMDSTEAVLSVSAAGFGVLKLKKRLPHVPFIMQAHGTSWGEVISKWKSAGIRNLLSSVRNLLWMPKDLLAYTRFDAVVAVGPRVFDDLNSLPAKFFLHTGKVRLIHNGIDTTLFRPSLEGRTQTRNKLGVDARAPVVLSASRLHPQKGVANVLRAFALLRSLRPETILLVAGDGPDKARLEAISSELKLTDHVRFLGALDREELAGVYQASDALVFLTEHVEVGLPLNGLEALATGLPCVVSSHLRLFPSPLLHRFGYADAEGVAGKLDEILQDASVARTSQLASEFHLFESAQGYLKILSSLEHQAV